MGGSRHAGGNQTTISDFGHSCARVPETPHIAAYPRVWLAGAVPPRHQKIPADRYIRSARLLETGLIAMQKVVGSNPISRLQRSRPSAGISSFATADRPHGERPKIEPGHLLSVIAEAVDDGFYPASSLASDFPKLRHRELVRLRKRALREGLLLERRGPDGRAYRPLDQRGLADASCPSGR